MEMKTAYIFGPVSSVPNWRELRLETASALEKIPMAVIIPQKMFPGREEEIKKLKTRVMIDNFVFHYRHLKETTYQSLIEQADIGILQWNGSPVSGFIWEAILLVQEHVRIILQSPIARHRAPDIIAAVCTYHVKNNDELAQFLEAKRG